MQLCEFLDIHSATNNLTFLMLYEAKVMANWLQTFRQKIRVPFSKGQRAKTILSVEDITTIFQRIVRKIVIQ